MVNLFFTKLKELAPPNAASYDDSLGRMDRTRNGKLLGCQGHYHHDPDLRTIQGHAYEVGSAR